MKTVRKRVTQAQVAGEAGVSQTAVSSILSGSGALNLSEETRRKVLAVAERLGYLVRGSTSRTDKLHALIVESSGRSPIATDEPWMEDAYTTFTGKIITTSGCCLQQRGAGMSVFHLDLGDTGAITQWLADSDIGGVLWHAGDSNSALLHWIASRVPLVLLNREWEAPVCFDSVSVDQEQNILIAAEHLWSRGHRRIAMFGHYPGTSFCRRRMSAYFRFVEEKGLRNYGEFQQISDAPEIPALEKVAAIIETWKRLGKAAPSALIMTDVFALPLLRQAAQADIRIPDDLSIVGIDNTAPCALVDPALTSVDQPLEEMSRVAVDLLFRRKADPLAPSQSVKIRPRLVVRESVINGNDEQSRTAYQEAF